MIRIYLISNICIWLRKIIHLNKLLVTLCGESRVKWPCMVNDNHDNLSYLQ